MRYIVIIISTFGLVSIYNIGVEIIQTNIQSHGTGYNLPYNLAGAIGGAFAISAVAIPIILYIYTFMTKTKENEVLEKKYPIKFILTAFIVIVLIESLRIYGSISMETENSNSSITKIQKISKEVVYSEIEKKDIKKSVQDFVDGTNSRIRRSNGFVQLDEITRQQYSQANKNIAIQRFIINKKGLLKIYSKYYGNDVNKITKNIKDTVKTQNINAMCSVKAIKIFMEKGMKMEFIYQFDDGTFMTSFIFGYEDCPKN